jgi:hypothetical protein
MFAHKTFRKLLSHIATLGRIVAGRRARQLYLTFLLLVVAISSVIRVRSYLITRRFQIVLARLAQLKVDSTSEEQFVRSVPYLLRDAEEEDREGTHLRHFYRGVFSNDNDMRWLRWFRWMAWPFTPRSSGFSDRGVENKWNCLDASLKAAYLLGWRHMAFHAGVVVEDGVVSSVSYDIEPDVFAGWPASYLVVARSAHGFWAMRNRPVPVSSVDDDSPEYRFGSVAGEFTFIRGADASIGVAYTPDAPPDKIAHVYEVDLSCFWGLRGCDSVRQVVPRLWEDQRKLWQMTDIRLTSLDSCPDRILAGRVRTLPDLNVALLEAIGSRYVVVNREGEFSQETATDFRLKEVILGHPLGPWIDMRYRDSIRWPLSPTGNLGNAARWFFPRAGESFLYFSGVRFDSCRIVPATPSAEEAVRAAVPAAKRSEDDISWMWGRM